MASKTDSCPFTQQRVREEDMAGLAIANQCRRAEVSITSSGRRRMDLEQQRKQVNYSRLPGLLIRRWRRNVIHPPEVPRVEMTIGGSR